MKKCFKKCFILLLTTAMITTCFSGCRKKESLITFRSYEEAEEEFADDYDSTGTVCENEKWRLTWDYGTKRVRFEDKVTGAVWGQIPFETEKPVMQENGMIKKNHPQLESVIHVVYQNPQSFDDVTAYSYPSSVQNDGVYAQQIKNGLRLTYDFSDYEFSVPVDFTISEDAFHISIDPKGISEGKEFKVHSVAVAPFLCGLPNDAQNSWLFLPDGSGTIIRPRVTDGVGTIGEQFVYGKDLTYQSYAKPMETQQIHFPVYGVKKDKSALFAIISSGAEATSLKWNVGSENIGYSSVYPQFCVRGFSYIKRPENFVTTTTLGSFKIFSDGIITQKIQIDYYSLPEEKANICGMAECYREYLKKNFALDQKSQNEKKATLKYIGAAKQPSFVLGVPSEKLLALTTTKQAEQMTAELTDAIGNDVNVQMVGFGDSGINVGKVAGNFKVAGNLGGNDGMKALVSALDKKQIQSFMDFDLISFAKSGNGFSKKDAATYPNGQIAWYTNFDNVSRTPNEERFYILSRDNLFKASEKVTERAKKIGLRGISYQSLSKTVFSDYGSQKYYINGQMGKDVSQILRDTAKADYKTMSSAANVYAAVSANYISDTPLYSSQYVIADYDVPFYSLVFKGYRPMSSVSLNLCVNSRDALLRCVAAGISPSYTLYHDYASELSGSDYSFVYGAEYGGNKDFIISSVNEIGAYLDSIEGATVSDYINLNEFTSATIFDNGVVAVVNFSGKEQKTEYGVVPPKSFVTGRGVE